MNKVIVGLKGGLGNQLFQYAIGKQLSILNNCNLKLDISSFNNYLLHNYSLSHFNIVDEIAKKREIPYQYLTGNRYLRKLNTFVDPILNNISIIKEKSLSFDNSILRLDKESIYLDGYWQSEKYFTSISDVIQNCFRLKNDGLSDTRISIINKIKKTNSISIHIRRGDYTIPKYNKVHGLTTLEYYKKAISYISKRVDFAELFIFSDDNQWIRETFSSFPNATIIEGTAEKNYLDLLLMAQCKHNIIANSTFSWWGAWLNLNPEKIVIAPIKWYNIESMNSTTIDLIPKNWIRL